MLRWYLSAEGDYITEEDSIGIWYTLIGCFVDIGPAKTGTEIELRALLDKLNRGEVTNDAYCQVRVQENRQNHCRVIQFPKVQDRKVTGSGLQVRERPDEPGSIRVTDFECPHCFLSYYSTNKNATCPACGSKPNIREDEF